MQGRFVPRCPRLFSGTPADWEECCWNFKSCMFDAAVKTLLDDVESRQTVLADDAGDVDNAATQAALNSSRQLHYLLANLTTDSARLIVRQNLDSNGFETQLLDSKLSPATFESDFNTWETIQNRYEQQVGTPLPDGVLVAPLLNKTTGALQQHLRPNARTLQTSQQTRDTIVEHFRSKQLILGANSSSSNGPAPMDVGAVTGKGRKGQERKRKRVPLELCQRRR